MYPKLILAVVMMLALSACGFHLRGTHSVDLPPGYQTLRFNAGGFINSETAALLQNALMERANVHFRNDKKLPAFVFLGESLEMRVLSVNVTTVAPTDFLLVYRLSYGLQNAEDMDLMPPRQVYLLRDFRYDTSDALGMERVIARLQNEMRESAVDRVVQQLGYMTEKLKPITASEPEK